MTGAWLRALAVPALVCLAGGAYQAPVLRITSPGADDILAGSHTPRGRGHARECRGANRDVLR